MGKYAATRGFQRATKDWKGPNATLENNPISEWLYGSWSKEKLREFELLHQVPILRQYMDYLLDVRADDEYLNRYGMDYSDIHNPLKLKQAHSGFSYIGSIIGVSENIAKLYL